MLREMSITPLESGFAPRESLDPDIYRVSTGPYRPPHILMRGPKNQLHLVDHSATYIFVAEGQVISIHFDNERGKIFYQGHSLENIEMTSAICGYLADFQNRLALDPKGRTMHSGFSRRLNELIRSVATHNGPRADLAHGPAP